VKLLWGIDTALPGRLHQRLEVPLVLLGIADNEIRKSLVKLIAFAHIACDQRGLTGPGVRSGQRPAAILCVLHYYAGGEQLD